MNGFFLFLRKSSRLWEGLLAFLFCLCVSRAEAQKTDLAPYEACLNRFRTLKAKFLQIDPQGKISYGIFYLSRPGYMRVEYAKNPEGGETLPLLIVADGRKVIHYDKATRETQYYTFDTTPAGFFLKEKISLSGEDVFVQRVTTSHHATEIEITKKGSPDEGSLILVFGENPRQLKKWIIRDAYQQETTVSLEEIAENIILEGKLFDVGYKDPHQLVLDPGGEPGNISAP